MQSTNDRNSDIDDISVNTNLRVFNGGLGLNKNQKKDKIFNNAFNKIEKNKISTYNKDFLDSKEKNSKENSNNVNNINSKFKEINLDKDSLIEAEGIISFRSKKVSKNDIDETPDLNNITNGIINKIDKLNKNAIKKENRNTIENNLNASNANEELTINKIFKLNDEKETEKEIKNFEKESQRIQSKILAGNPLESSSSDSSEDYEKYESNNTKKIKNTLDNINMRNLHRTGREKSNLYKTLNENKNFKNNYSKNYNTISGNERIDIKKESFELGNNASNDSGDRNEKNIFWNLRGHNDEIDDVDYNNHIKRPKSAIDRDYKSEKIKHHKSKKSEKECPVSNFKGTLSKIEKGYAIFVTTDDVIMLLPSFLIPRNLGIGDTFTFKIYEVQKYNNKVNNIFDIQKKYTKSIGK